jgi:hypothetical protein
MRQLSHLVSRVIWPQFWNIDSLSRVSLEWPADRSPL